MIMGRVHYLGQNAECGEPRGAGAMWLHSYLLERDEEALGSITGASSLPPAI